MTLLCAERLRQIATDIVYPRRSACPDDMNRMHHETSCLHLNEEAGQNRAKGFRNRMEDLAKDYQKAEEFCSAILR